MIKEKIKIFLWQAYLYVFRYGIMKRLKRGVRISISLTFRCNLQCPYCSLRIPLGKMPTSKESSLSYIKEKILDFPYRIREISITGGAAELHPDFIELVNWLLNKGYYVNVFTNLVLYNKLKQLPQSRKLLFTASYHHTKDWEQCSVEEYIKTYKEIRKKYRINVEEIEERRLSFSRVKRMTKTEEDLGTGQKVIRFAPDMTMKRKCVDLHKSQINEM